MRAHLMDQRGSLTENLPATLVGFCVVGLASVWLLKTGSGHEAMEAFKAMAPLKRLLVGLGFMLGLLVATGLVSAPLYFALGKRSSKRQD